ncbi:MAG: NUDIX domain-containing protein [Bacteroidota bacterium]
MNDKPVIFSGMDKIPAGLSKALVTKADSREKMKESFRRFIYSPDFDSLYFISKANDDKLFEDFISLFRYLEAAGGIVHNNMNERLFIYRFGKWDLPKGKIEKAEKPKEAALREVTEETGLKGPQIFSDLPSTFHIYEHKGKMVFKKTFWYAMTYAGEGQPVPQTEEAITEAKWFGPDEFNIIFNNTYASLFSLINADLKLKQPLF